MKPGDRIEFLGKKEATRERVKKTLPFEIVYEDEELLVADKPAGLLTISTETEKERTLYYEVTAYVRTVKKENRVFVVHRLDRETSGLVVFAKNPKSKAYLQENWEQAEKKYAAVVEGRPHEREGEVRSRLAEDKFKRVYKSSSREARESVTYYRILTSNGRYSMLELQLGTGRKNQIRVHMADLGNPVAGDFKYGAHSDPLGRMALHAFYLSFPHPLDDNIKVFRSTIPEPFSRLCKA